MADEMPNIFHPTLYIGLGGTGKEVLLRLRRRFYERWRKVGVPSVGYLWIDTDSRDGMAQNEALDEIDKVLMFKELEQIQLLDKSVGTDLHEILTDDTRFGYIHDWLPDEVQTYGTQVADGAGAIRSIGRLTLNHHFPRVRNTIAQILKDIQSDGAKQKTVEEFFPGTTAKAPQQVYVIFSVAGGTGGGTFLDIAFLLQQMGFKNTVGIAVMPNVYHNANSGMVGKRALANGYSAMKELEHFTHRLKVTDEADGNIISPDFEVQWEADTKPLTIPGPPFSLLYLCENVDECDVSIQNRHQLFHMLAESLFVTFLPGQFANTRSSRLSNVQNMLRSAKIDHLEMERKGVEVSLNRVYARGYGSLGMAKIEVPTESIREACSANLAQEILHYWNRPARDPNLARRVDDSMAGRFDAAGIERRFGNGYQSEIEEQLQAKLPSFEQLKGPRAEVASYLAQLEDELRKAEDFLFKSSGQTSEDWGRVKNLLHNSVPRCSEDLQKDLNAWAAEQLDKPDLGLAALVENAADARGMIPLLQSRLRKIYWNGDGVCEAEERAREDEKNAEDWAAQQQWLLREMIQTQTSSSIGLLAARSWTLNHYCTQLREATEKVWQFRASAILSREARLVAEAMERPLKLLMDKLTAFRKELDSSEAMMKTLQGEYLDFTKGVRSIRIFDREQDYPRFYRLGYDEGKREHRTVSPSEESEQFARDLKKMGNGTMDIIEFHANDGMKRLIERLRDYSSDRFAKDFSTCVTHECPRKVEVLTHAKSGGIAKVAHDLVESAAPMMRTGLDAHDADSAAQAYLSVPNNTGADYIDFIDRVTRGCHDRGWKDLNVLITGDRTRIQLQVERYAFPLSKTPAIVKECEAAYSQFYRQDFDNEMKQYRIPLHINKKWEGEFEDLVPLTPREARSRMNAVEILSMGPVLGVIKVQLNSGRRRYYYSEYAWPASQTVPLGNRRLAIEKLDGNQVLQDALLGAIQARHEEKVRLAASENPEERQKAIDYAWALAYMRHKLLFSGTPELAIAAAHLATLSQALGKHAPVIQDTDQVVDVAQSALAGKVAWNGGFPMLDPNQPWVLGQPEHARPR